MGTFLQGALYAAACEVTLFFLTALLSPSSFGWSNGSYALLRYTTAGLARVRVYAIYLAVNTSLADSRRNKCSCSFFANIISMKVIKVSMQEDF